MLTLEPTTDIEKNERKRVLFEEVYLMMFAN